MAVSGVVDPQVLRGEVGDRLSGVVPGSRGRVILLPADLGPHFIVEVDQVGTFCILLHYTVVELIWERVAKLFHKVISRCFPQILSILESFEGNLKMLEKCFKASFYSKCIQNSSHIKITLIY